MKFYQCEKCGKIVEMIKPSACPVKCCGEAMTEMVPNTTDAAHEKHIPVIEQNGNLVTVTVSEAEHPMLEAHYIEWIALETTQGSMRKCLAPGEKPQAVFALADGESVVAAWEHCHLHGLWQQGV